MTWTYTFHRFPNRAAFDAVYDAAGLRRIRNNNLAGMNGQIVHSEIVEFDVCGTLHDPAEYNSQGVMIKPAAELQGFFVNVAWRGEMSATFSASQISPNKVLREFA